jgi:hypothetical protein
MLTCNIVHTSVFDELQARVQEQAASPAVMPTELSEVWPTWRPLGECPSDDHCRRLRHGTQRCHLQPHCGRQRAVGGHLHHPQAGMKDGGRFAQCSRWATSPTTATHSCAASQSTLPAPRRILLLPRSTAGRAPPFWRWRHGGSQRSGSSWLFSPLLNMVFQIPTPQYYSHTESDMGTVHAACGDETWNAFRGHTYLRP